MATEIEAYLAKTLGDPENQKSKAKSTSSKAPKEKKSAVANKPRVHPPYLDMIKEAISTLKERTGSSQYAIAKFIEDKQKDLPPNFKKLLLVQLKKLVASGKLTKVKNSYKLSAPVKSPAAAPAVAKKAPAEKKAVAKKVAVKPKKATAAAPAKAKKATAATPVKAKKKVVKKAAEKKPKKVAKTAKVTTPGKKKAVEKVKVKVAPAKKTPVKKTVKKVKTLKSPAKKAVGKKGKK